MNGYRYERPKDGRIGRPPGSRLDRNFTSETETTSGTFASLGLIRLSAGHPTGQPALWSLAGSEAFSTCWKFRPTAARICGQAATVIALRVSGERVPGMSWLE